ncbi:hypothetical protein CDV36_000834 [Fusarium kuroshium]|uniref:Uncharacterized protein n=1 Tax=Fusarium kuroshium TaxID=2010991 RepID=A0A3M2SPJ4_9HYPO|nr:hypothetical protein CDV36_000834 [Fusarium kuroshium]
MTSLWLTSFTRKAPRPLDHTDLIRLKAFKKPSKGGILYDLLAQLSLEGRASTITKNTFPILHTEKDDGWFIRIPFISRDMLSIGEVLDQGDELEYWDSSYGSALELAFIVMFSDRVGLILLDGTMHVNDYLISTWISSTRGSKKALQNLFAEAALKGDWATILEPSDVRPLAWPAAAAQP